MSQIFKLRTEIHFEVECKNCSNTTWPSAPDKKSLFEKLRGQSWDTFKGKWYCHDCIKELKLKDFIAQERKRQNWWRKFRKAVFIISVRILCGIGMVAILNDAIQLFKKSIGEGLWNIVVFLLLGFYFVMLHLEDAWDYEKKEEK